MHCTLVKSTALTAYANEYSLDKEQTSYSDSLDALLLSLKSFKID